ncbi:DUF1883 domain-containing protein [Chromobacterium violaceum]|uniref:DUF1883 domain-containing protein n=1 Tax=Chromobacterium violaceum TaxID=536 RepID=UPI00194EBCF8|nr:DUF1883 domain-containing protein [Chromobacterium violaceum]QRQ16054.1 DUF1883 domain-containing protein [Chromobacterium violaceum]
MSFLHTREYLEEGDIVVVDCSHRCNVKLTDDSNFYRYKNGGQYKYFGGYYERLPVRIVAPHSGNWNITIDLNGGSATIKHSIQIIRR